MKTRKIDFYRLDWGGVWHYQASTNWHKTCREAKAAFLASHPEIPADKIKACRAQIERGQA